MKKIISIILIFLVAFAGLFVLTGCDIKKDSENATSTEGIEYPDDGSTRLILNTEGLGQVSYYVSADLNVSFDDEKPNQEIVTVLDDVSRVTIEAKADTGWKFVKWVDVDGNDYSTTIKNSVKLKKGKNNIYTAVFEENK